MGRIKANDGDEGENAEMKYKIVDGDGKDYLDIITDEITQEGVIVVKKVKSCINVYKYVMIYDAIKTHNLLDFHPENGLRKQAHLHSESGGD